MNFEHLIQINASDNPMLPTLTREQLWEGLVLRAEQPQLFVIGLDSCEIQSRTDTVLERELHFGQATIRDRVTFTPNHQVRYDIHAADGEIGGSLTMTIEERADAELFLRFEYRTTLPETADSEDARQTQGIIKEAYRTADIDTVRLIREYAQGRRDPDPLH
ncbi:SRPBCC family protein [Burkholderia gladioli]|uniref:SRPBCC family protein n=1 Tax=Burkholderia gladioli TaxID=28095 RepID=UPI00163DF5A5|nr:SRPBCC family protein [Burkholderia gladioli]